MPRGLLYIGLVAALAMALTACSSQPEFETPSWTPASTAVPATASATGGPRDVSQTPTSTRSPTSTLVASVEAQTEPVEGVHPEPVE
jgi:hypothetical protein